MSIYLPHFSWLSATAIALSGITTTVAAAELKVLSIGDGDTIRVTGPGGVNKTTELKLQRPFGSDFEDF